MTNVSRRMGINILAALNNMHMSPEQFADDLGYSLRDTYALLEGRKFIPPFELKKIADKLNVSAEGLIDDTPVSEIPGLEYRKKFSNPDNLDKVLDLMDEYAACKEALED